jgi:NADH:ubiquinone oxidoreductase subunit 6 (subunit J)
MTSLFGAAFDWAEVWPILPPLAAGAGSIYLLLPRPRPYPKLWGVLLGGLALLLAGWLVLRAGTFDPETVLFYTFSAVAVVSGTLLVTQHNPARAALSFALVVLSSCGLYLLLAAPFLMAATTIIYAGAIVVTFLFVLMLAQQEGHSDADDRSREPLLATVTGFVLLGALLYVLDLSYGTGGASPATREIDALLADTHQLRAEARTASDKGAREELIRVVKAGEDLLPRYRMALRKPQVRWLDLPDLAEGIDRLSLTWPLVGEPPRDESGKAADLQRLRKAVEDLATNHLNELGEIGWKARGRIEQQLACLQPHGNRSERFSNLSGPPPAVELTELRRDGQGRPQLPAENSAYLGRSLFTDYLLPVELGGTLLLVATVGAIAIAQRRTNPQRPS